MTQKPTDIQRLRRPSWRDPRLLGGILIVLLSTAAVVALVMSQDRTTAVYAAERQLSTGDQLSDDDVRVVHVQLDDLADHYLSAADPLPAEGLLLRAVLEGELIPRTALGESDPEGRQPVTVNVEQELARAVQVGRRVDVWAATAESPTDEAAVERLVTDAEVIDIRETASAFGSQSAVTVELLIEVPELPDLLAAEGSAAVLSVLPAGTQQP